MRQALRAVRPVRPQVVYSVDKQLRTAEVLKLFKIRLFRLVTLANPKIAFVRMEVSAGIILFQAVLQVRPAVVFSMAKPLRMVNL